MQDPSFVEYLQESMYDSPLKTAIMDLYTLLENGEPTGIPTNTIKIPSEYRPLIADKIIQALQTNQISKHAKTGSKRYKRLGHEEFSQTHEKAEDAVKEYQEGQLPLNIVPLYYQNKRYIACAELPDNDMIMIVTGDAPYPPDPTQPLSILTYFAGLAGTRKDLLSHVMQHPDEVTADEPALWEAWQKEHKQQMQDHPFFRKNKPATQLASKEEYQAKLDDILSTISQLRKSLNTHKQEYNTLNGKISKLQSTMQKEQNKINAHSQQYNNLRQNFMKQFNETPDTASTSTEPVSNTVVQPSNIGTVTANTADNPYQYHEKFEQIRQKRNELSQVITDYTQKLTQMKAKIKELQQDPSQASQLDEARSQYKALRKEYDELTKQTINYKHQIQALVDKYRSKFNKDLINDDAYVRMGKKLRWYEPQQPAGQEQPTTDAAE